MYILKSLKKWLFMLATTALLLACKPQKADRLPVLGAKTVQNGDTVYHTIPEFRFVDQDSATVTLQTFRDKVYVADFFFTSCQTICPVMTTQMMRVYRATQDLDDVLILSHTIDPKRDTVARLHDFAQRLGVPSQKWRFVTGPKEVIYRTAQEGYFASAVEDSSAQDNFIHSGAFLLIDKDKRIRGKYDGTDEKEVSQLIDDIKKLLRERS